MIKETNVLKNAIENNIPAVDCFLSLYMDSFEENITEAINVNFNKKSFDIDKTQFLISSKDLEVEEIKSLLIRKGMKEEKIKIIDDWSKMPLSIRKINSDILIEIIHPYLINEYKYKSNMDIGRLSILASSFIRDLKNSDLDFSNLPEFNFDNIPENFIYTKEVLDELYISSEKYEVIFSILNEILDLFYVDNELEEDLCYLFKSQNIKEEMMTATFLRRISLINKTPNICFDQDESSLSKKIIFVDFKDFIVESYSVMAAMERGEIKINMFLKQESFQGDIYPEEEMNSIKANALLKYGKKNTPLKRLMNDKGFINYYYTLKESNNI